MALTRAQHRLTITTLAEKKGKVPTFIEDIVMEPAIKRRDVIQTAPKVRPADAKNAAGTAAAITDPSLFPASASPPKIFSRISEWAESFHPPAPEPLQLSPSAVENYRKCPQQYLFGYLWSLKEGPKATLSFGSIKSRMIKSGFPS